MNATIMKLKDYFDEMIVYKDLRKSNFLSAFSLPSFLRDWLLKKFEDENGEYDLEEVTCFVKEYLPKKEDWQSIKNRIVLEYENVKILTQISVNIDIKTQEITFSLPAFGLGNKETLIEPSIWENVKDNLVNSKEVWGVVELGYRQPDEFSKPKIPGKITLTNFKDFCPYKIDLDYFKEARNYFSLDEWLDVLLGAIDYNASGYENQNQKLSMLTRLLPFIEKRLNLIELAPKGTGKSYLFGRVSKYGWLSSGGIMSRAKMFYDINKKTRGLVCGNDYVALDEVQTISFSDVSEMRAALKGYMESGEFTIGNYKDTAESGIILLGNISKENMNIYSNMFSELPEVFQESALLDRFHGFIQGWNIPRMKEDLKISGWALNSEYFNTIMHLLRDDGSYRALVDKLIKVPENSDTRDTEAIKRITTAYLKLLFPNAVLSEENYNKEDFYNYCLKPAKKMRQIIKLQLGMLDSEFLGKDIPKLELRED